MQSFHPPQRILLGPGPSDVAPRVLAALARPTVGHLDPTFVAMMDEVKVLLRRAFRTQNALTFPVSAPGSAGMETCVHNLVECGDTVVIAQNGVFGGRLAEVVRRAGGQPVVVQGEWGRAVDVAAVDKVLGETPEASVLCFVHAETSTGARSDAHALANLARQHGCLSLCDAVTSLGGSPLEVDAWGLDAVYSGSQKCLSCVPGLSPVTFSERAVARMKGRKQAPVSWFLDASLVANYWDGEGGRSYHHTAPVNSLYALHEALLMLDEEGLDAAHARHELHHRALVAGLEVLGLGPSVPKAERLWQLNAVSVPAGVDDKVLRTALLHDAGIEIGGGLGPLAGQVVRIGLMGSSATRANVLRLLAALPTAVSRAGGRVSGSGREAIAAASAVLGATD